MASSRRSRKILFVTMTFGIVPLVTIFACCLLGLILLSQTTRTTLIKEGGETISIKLIPTSEESFREWAEKVLRDDGWWDDTVVVKQIWGSRNCSDTSQGFLRRTLVAIKERASQEAHITVDFEGEKVQVKYFVVEFDGFDFWVNAIDTKKINVTSDQAVKIADDAGGRNARIEVKDDCGISVLGEKGFWLIRYSARNEFCAKVDWNNGAMVSGQYYC